MPLSVLVCNVCWTRLAPFRVSRVNVAHLCVRDHTSRLQRWRMGNSICSGFEPHTSGTRSRVSPLLLQKLLYYLTYQNFGYTELHVTSMHKACKHEACSEFAMPFSRHNTTTCLDVEAVASHPQHSVSFNRPGILTPDLFYTRQARKHCSTDWTIAAITCQTFGSASKFLHGKLDFVHLHFIKQEFWI